MKFPKVTIHKKVPGFKPMKAAQKDPLSMPDFFERLKYPLICSPKLDGIRAFNNGGVLTSNSNKPLPNLAIQRKFKNALNFDGELICGTPYAEDVYNKTQSTVMSRDRSAEDVKFCVFDYVTEHTQYLPYKDRLELLRESADVVIVEAKLILNGGELLNFERACLEKGYEGIMMRNPKSPYKFGRSTFNEQGLLKLKRFKDDEALVVGFKEQMINNNMKVTNELGLSQRSTEKAGMVLGNTLGVIVVEYEGQELDVACGSMDHTERKEVWSNPSQYLGRYITFRHFTYGVKEKPRFPRFAGWRKGKGADV
jgi:DNA ligase-1